jgi:transposase
VGAVMERDPMKMLQVMLGLEDIRVLGAEETEKFVRLEIETTLDSAVCSRCGAPAALVGSRTDELVDLPIMGRPTRFKLKRRRWRCVTPSCDAKQWLEANPLS